VHDAKLEEIHELAYRAADWPGASKQERTIEAQRALVRTAALVDQFVFELSRAGTEATRARVAQGAGQATGVIAAIASIAGQVNPLLGVLGAIVVMGSKPLAEKYMTHRKNHYAAAWEQRLRELRPPERALFFAVLNRSQPALLNEMRQVGMLR